MLKIVLLLNLLVEKNILYQCKTYSFILNVIIIIMFKFSAQMAV